MIEYVKSEIPAQQQLDNSHNQISNNEYSINRDSENGEEIPESEIAFDGKKRDENPISGLLT